MGLFDFLFGSDESSTNGLFDIEDYRSIHEDRRHRAGSSSNWTSREDWDATNHIRHKLMLHHHIQYACGIESAHTSAL